MSLELIKEVFGDEIESAEEELQQPTQKTRVMKIETPLFDIHFKDFEYEDYVVSGDKGPHAETLLNLCDRFLQLFASAILRLKEIVCGQEAVVDGTAPQVVDLFTPEGKLKEEYASKLLPANIKEAETQYVRAIAYKRTANRLVDSWILVLPDSKNEPQLAWNSETNKSMRGFTEAAIQEAIKFRLRTSPSFKTMKRTVETRRTAKRNVDSLEINNIHDCLGF